MSAYETRRNLAELIFLLGYSCISAINGALAAEHIECPDAIGGATIQMNNPPKGWTLFVPDSLYLHSAAPIDGPPEQLGDLAEFSERRRGKELSYSYRLEGSFPSGKWIKCSYGVNGEVTLSKRIDDSISQCSFTYRKGIKAGQNEIKILCD